MKNKTFPVISAQNPSNLKGRGQRRDFDLHAESKKTK